MFALVCARPVRAGVPGFESPPAAVTEPAAEASPAEPAAENIPAPAPSDAPSPSASEVEAPLPTVPATRAASPDPVVNYPPPPGAPLEMQTAPPPRRHRRAVTPPPWPGRFIGVRAGLAGGYFSAPIALALSKSPSATIADGSAISSFVDTAPVLGVELGYCGRRWGVSFTFDAAPLGLIPGDGFASAPWHWVLGVDLNYVASNRFRWTFGIEPAAVYYGSLTDGSSVTLYSVGVRAGLHFRISDLPIYAGSDDWELFAHVTGNVLRDTSLTRADGSTVSFNTGSAGVSGQWVGYFSLVAGVQWTFSL